MEYCQFLFKLMLNLGEYYNIVTPFDLVNHDHFMYWLSRCIGDKILLTITM